MNKAFEALRGIKGLPSELRKASNDDPLFHLNDPMNIKGTHNKHESYRKPDVVLVSMGSASTAYGPDDYGAWSDYAFKPKKPNLCFGWGDILLTVEFKRTKSTVDKPPPEYKPKVIESIPPHSLHSTSERDEVAEPISGIYYD